uniref:Uncharacterized protein n=1 Tax=Globodera rostochiensis TaxID=31243 RepID=A0A914I0Y5_GLORO
MPSLDIGAASTFTFPVEFRQQSYLSRWLQIFEFMKQPLYYEIIFIISGEAACMKCADCIWIFEEKLPPFSGATHLVLMIFFQHNGLCWQPTDLKLINDYGVPNQEFMYPHFTMKSPLFNPTVRFAFFVTLDKKHVIFSGVFMGEQ